METTKVQRKVGLKLGMAFRIMKQPVSWRIGTKVYCKRTLGDPWGIQSEMKEGITREDKSRHNRSRARPAKKRRNNRRVQDWTGSWRLQMVRQPGPDCQAKKLGLNLDSTRGAPQAAE